MKKPKFNWKVTIPVSTLLLLGAIGFGVFLMGQMFASDILNELVRRESKGYYELDFEELNLNVFNKRITVNELVLKPDTTKNFAELGLNNLYEIELGQLLIDFESIYGFYFDKELDINNVRIVDPYINMVKLSSKKTAKFTMEAGDLYQAISDYLEVLKIDYFHIQDGALDYSQNDFSLGNIDFVVQNLLMDSVGRQNNVFFSEAIELEIRNQKFNLPDGIHTLRFESFLLSTKDSLLTFKNFELVPLAESGVTYEGDNDVNVYQIQVPELTLRGIDYVAAYQDNKLRVEELILNEPTVFIDDESHGEDQAEKADNSIMALIFNVFNTLEIGKLIINQAHIDLRLDNQEKYQRLKAEETNVELHEISIDSSNYQFHSRHEYFEDLILDVHDYQYFLPDSVHIADFSLLRINTIDEELTLQNLNIAPKLEHDSEFPTIEVHIPALGVYGMDYPKALLDRELVADTISVFTSKLLFENRRSKKKGAPVSVRGIFRAVKPFFERVDVDRLLVKGRKLDPSESIHLGSVDLNLKNLALNSRIKGWSDFMGSMNLYVRDFKLKQDSLKVNGSSLKGTLSGFDLIDWRVDLGKEKQKINGHFDTLKISGVTIDSVLAGHPNYFTRIDLIRPNFEFDMKSGAGGGGFEDHVEKELLIKDAAIRGTFDDWTVSIENLDTDVFEGDSTAFRSLESTNIFLQNDSLNHRIRLGRWNYDTLGGEMDFHDLSIVPLENDSSKAFISAFIPFIGLKDFEQAKFFNENNLILSELKVMRPDIKLFLPENENTEKSEQKSDSTLIVDIENILLDSVKFQFAGNGDAELISIDNTSVLLNEFDFPGPMISDDKLIYSNGVELSIDRITPVLKSDLDTELVGLEFSSDNNKLSLDTVYVSSKEGKFEMTLTATSIDQIDFNLLDKKGAVDVGDVKVGSVRGQNVLGVSKGEGGEFGYAKSLSIGGIDLPSIQWTISDLNKDKSYDIKSAYVQIAGIKSEDSLTLVNLPDRIESFQVGGQDFDLDLGGGYSLGLDEYKVSYPEQTVSLQAVSLKSQYPKDDYSYILDSQNDWFDVEVDEVQLELSEIRDIIAGNDYRMSKLDMQGLDAVIYRDKGVPIGKKKLKQLPQSELRKLKLPLIIDSLSIKGKLAYQEKAEKGTEAGEMTFDDLNLSITNLKSQVKDESEVMTMQANGLIMNSGKFAVLAQFQMYHPFDRFTLSGSLSDFQLESLNKMLVPVANVRINKGYAEEVNFNFTANDTLAQGEMRLKYNDLKVRILNAKAQEKGRQGGGIKSFFANTFVVKKKNPSFLFLRKGTIFHHRDTTKAIFNYWAKSLLSGSVSSIGIHKSDKEEKKFEKDLDARREEDSELVGGNK